MSMIPHDWDEAKNRALLRRSFEALPSGGAVIISELLVNDEKTGPAPAALMSLNMLIETAGETTRRPNIRRGSRKPASGTSRRSGSTHPPRTAR
nr:methyltransferase [Rhizobium laguerreae]